MPVRPVLWGLTVCAVCALSFERRTERLYEPVGDSDQPDALVMWSWCEMCEAMTPQTVVSKEVRALPGVRGWG
jgi:hypothetical protein